MTRHPLASPEFFVIPMVNNMTYLAPALAALPSAWQQVLATPAISAQLSVIDAQLADRAAAGAVIYPPRELVFNALRHVAPADIRVVIIGQDPYHGAGEAMGLSFSVPDGVKIPPSLRNIFLERQRDLGLPPPVKATVGSFAEPTTEAAQEEKPQINRRIAAMKGQKLPPEKPAARRDLLPDIEEINSSLKGGEGLPPGLPELEPAERTAQGSSFRNGFVLSLQVATVTGVLSAVLATFAAFVLVRYRRFLGRTIFSGMVNAPLVMPEVVIGLSLLLLAVGALLWLLPMGLLTWLYGWDGTLTQMAWFFTKAALLTFGGAYAVLPYVYQGAIGHYGWLTPTQMIDGLALGETTPGPLIMVVAFVAFVGAYLQPVFGGDSGFVSGALAAALVTWFTFLPSFLFILAGGPLVESTHGELKFTAPLTAITAAVVGVILNLALFFGYHVLWPEGFAGRFDWPSALLALAAALALFRFKRGVIEVIGACAGLGLALQLLLH